MIITDNIIKNLLYHRNTSILLQGSCSKCMKLFNYGTDLGKDNIGKDNIGKTKTITLKQALQLVNLPSFTSDKMITLSTHKIDKASFKTYELDLLDTIEDYYKGYCPKKLMIKKLKDYPYYIQPIIQYLYK